MSRSFNIRTKTKFKFKSKQKQEGKPASAQIFNSPALKYKHPNKSYYQNDSYIFEPTNGLGHSEQIKDYKINQLQYLGLPAFHTNPFKIQAYRTRLSIDFRELHDQQKIQVDFATQKIKRSLQIDRSLIVKRARMITQNIYQQQFRDYKQQNRLKGRIKQRLALLKNINEQKSELIRSYFIPKK